MNKINIVVFLNFNCVLLTWAFNCHPPIGCEITDAHYQTNYFGYEKTSIEMPGVLCNIRDKQFQFNYPMPTPLLVNNDRCVINQEYFIETIEFRFHSDFIMSKQFNFTNMLNYMDFFNYFFYPSFVNLKGFELDIINGQNINIISQRKIERLFCVRCKIEFYSNRRPVKTCQDINDSNNTSIRSLFQIQFQTNLFESNGLTMVLLDPQFKSTLCPLVFKNSNIADIEIRGLVDTFYKTNILAFENRTFNDLNSTIRKVYTKIENINIDSNLLNPSVFQNLEEIYFYGSVNKIDGKSLNALNRLSLIEFTKDNYRDMIHKNGIEWIRDLNTDINVDFSNFNELRSNYANKMLISFEYYTFLPQVRLSKLLPDEDFCIYKDFPFNQLVILMELVYGDKILELLNSTSHYSCTYLWLAQYFPKFLQFHNER